MARVIVTGGAGFIGSHLVDALVAHRHRVTVVDDLSSGRRENVPDGVELIREDIRSRRMKDIWRDARPEYVFHLAAQKNLQDSIVNPLHDAEINISGSLNIIHLSDQFRVKKFIFSSSGGAVYGPVKKIPTPETVSPEPSTPYGISKHTIEQYLRFYQTHRRLRSVSLRYANVYGPRQDPNGEAGVVAVFVKRLFNNEPIVVNGHGRQTRDYVYVDDAVEANLLALQNDRANGNINIGTGRKTSVNELAKILQRVAGQRVRIKHRSALAGDASASALQPGLAKKMLTWKPAVRLDEGLASTWRWMQEGTKV